VAEEIKSLTLPRIELWQVSISSTTEYGSLDLLTPLRLVATASVSSHIPVIRGVGFLKMVENWSPGRTAAWKVCCASENILQHFEFGAAQNRVSIKGM
jgi:hypothetical protein